MTVTFRHIVISAAGPNYPALVVAVKNGESCSDCDAAAIFDVDVAFAAKIDEALLY